MTRVSGARNILQPCAPCLHVMAWHGHIPFHGHPCLTCLDFPFLLALSGLALLLLRGYKACWMMARRKEQSAKLRNIAIKERRSWTHEQLEATPQNQPTIK